MFNLGFKKVILNFFESYKIMNADKKEFHLKNKLNFNKNETKRIVNCK